MRVRRARVSNRRGCVGKQLRTGGEAKAGVPQIEVTHDMIEAGRSAELVCFERFECDPADAAMVYIAMAEAAHAYSSKP